MINKIYLEEKAVKMMVPYHHAEPLSRLVEQLEKGRELVQAGGQTISDAMMMSKGITILAQTGVFNNEIREWRRKYSDLNTWAKYKCFFHRTHQEQKRAVTTAVRGGYTASVQNIYNKPPPPP